MIRSVGDFLNIINRIYPKKEVAFFRGQSSSEYDISSTVYRFIPDKEDKEEKNLNKISKKLFDRFKENLPVYPEPYVLKNYSMNDIDILMTSQHYGMPSRLIDWSRNPLVALYFAVEGEKHGLYASVFMLKNSQKNPLIVSSGKDFIKNISADKKYVMNAKYLFDKALLEYKGIGLASEVSKNSCMKILTELIHGLGKLIAETLEDTDKYYFINLHDRKEQDFHQLGLYLSYRMNTIFDKIKLGWGVELLDREFFNIINELYLAERNHAYGIPGIEIYGNDNLILNPLPINNRIENQQGVFLFSKKCNSPEFLEKNFEVKENLIISMNDINERVNENSVVRIDIKNRYLNKIKRELSCYGMTESFIYPELSSFSKEIKKDVLLQFSN